MSCGLEGDGLSATENMQDKKPLVAERPRHVGGVVSNLELEQSTGLPTIHL